MTLDQGFGGEIGHRQIRPAPSPVSLPLLRGELPRPGQCRVAALAMNQDLGFTPSIFGAGAGIFFIGYLLFEIPSNLALQHFGRQQLPRSP